MTPAAPLDLHREIVRPEWIDYNGHFNLAYYVLVFDHATDRFFEHLGLGRSFRRRRQTSTFAAEIHVCYLRELMQGDEVRVTTQLLDYDSKRIHFFHRMHHAEAGYLAATNELIGLYMDMRTRKVTTMPDEIQNALRNLRQAHAALPPPEQQGRVIGVNRPASA